MTQRCSSVTTAGVGWVGGSMTSQVSFPSPPLPRKMVRHVWRAEMRFEPSSHSPYPTPTPTTRDSTLGTSAQNGPTRGHRSSPASLPHQSRKGHRGWHNGAISARRQHGRPGKGLPQAGELISCFPAGVKQRSDSTPTHPPGELWLLRRVCTAPSFQVFRATVSSGEEKEREG